MIKIKIKLKIIKLIEIHLLQLLLKLFHQRLNNNKINFIAQLRRDHQKKEFCEINNIKLIELYEEDDLSASGIESVIKNNE